MHQIGGSTVRCQPLSNRLLLLLMMHLVDIFRIGCVLGHQARIVVALLQDHLVVHALEVRKVLVVLSLLLYHEASAQCS